MVGLEAAGAVSRYSKTTGSSLAGWTTMKPPPPMLPAAGYVTARAKAVATAASTALPPCLRTPSPASDPGADTVTTTPLRTSAGCFAALVPYARAVSQVMIGGAENRLQQASAADKSEKRSMDVPRARESPKIRFILGQPPGLRKGKTHRSSRTCLTPVADSCPTRYHSARHSIATCPRLSSLTTIAPPHSGQRCSGWEARAA